ncbi:MAG: Gx transporter family protein [Lachnospiraceae bacterium]|nr:Gx transporter family protein [Lachnospiraceae bacterium]
MNRKIAYYGLLVALAFIFSYVESLFPINFGIPGIKLGLANLVVIVALYIFGIKEAIAVSLIRIVLSGLTFSSIAAMAYSLAGGILSLAVMIIAKRLNKLSAMGVSVLGGVFHNVGQILVAIVVLETGSLIYYLPVLIISGLIAGIIIGILAAEVIKRLPKTEERSPNT